MNTSLHWDSGCSVSWCKRSYIRIVFPMAAPSIYPSFRNKHNQCFDESLWTNLLLCFLSSDNQRYYMAASFSLSWFFYLCFSWSWVTVSQLPGVDLFVLEQHAPNTVLMNSSPLIGIVWTAINWLKPDWCKPSTTRNRSWKRRNALGY